MLYQITHIRLTTQFAKSPQQIKEIKLKSGAIETVAQAAYFINLGCHYFYIDKTGKSCMVSSVHEIFKPPYIKTILQNSDRDGLLDLPYF